MNICILSHIPLRKYYAPLLLKRGPLFVQPITEWLLCIVMITYPSLSQTWSVFSSIAMVLQRVLVSACMPLTCVCVRVCPCVCMHVCVCVCACKCVRASTQCVHYVMYVPLSLSLSLSLPPSPSRSSSPSPSLSLSLSLSLFLFLSMWTACRCSCFSVFGLRVCARVTGQNQLIYCSSAPPRHRILDDACRVVKIRKCHLATHS